MGVCVLTGLLCLFGWFSWCGITCRDKERDYDFLSSIELVIVDQADVILTQNWEHLLNVFACINQKITTSHDTDFSRVRHCYLDGLYVRLWHHLRYCC